jgi:transcriptional regulator with XRE-family HTH domain
MKVGLTQASVAKILDRSQGQVHKIEKGSAMISPEGLAKLTERFEIPPDVASELRELLAAAKDDQNNAAELPDWSAFQELIRHEAAASKILCWHSERIPGPLQCEPYIIQVMTEVYGDVDTTEVIKLRKARSELLTKPDMPDYHVILSESSVLRTIAGREHILTDQVEHLLTLVNTYERLSLQILPLRADLLFVDSDFELLRFDDRKGDFAYVEYPGGARRVRDRKDLKKIDDHWTRLHTAALSRVDSKTFLENLPN